MGDQVQIVGFEAAVRAVLIRLIERDPRSISALAVECGRGNNYFARKLSPQSEESRRPLAPGDVDDLLGILRVPPSDFAAELRAVLVEQRKAVGG